MPSAPCKEFQRITRIKSGPSRSRVALKRRPATARRWCARMPNYWPTKLFISHITKKRQAKYGPVEHNYASCSTPLPTICYALAFPRSVGNPYRHDVAVHSYALNAQ